MDISSLVASTGVNSVDLFYKNVDKTEKTSDETSSTNTTQGMDTVSISSEAKALYAASQYGSGQESSEESGSGAAAGGGGGAAAAGSSSESDTDSIKAQIAALQAQLSGLSNSPEDMAKAAGINAQIGALQAQLSAMEDQA